VEGLREEIRGVLAEYRIWDWRDSLCNKLVAVVEERMLRPLDNQPQHKVK